MKFIPLYFLLVINSLVFSCQKEELDITYKKIPVFNIEVPQENIDQNFAYDISFSYALPNACYEFGGMEYDDSDGNIRIITAFANVQNETNCTMEYQENNYSFPFTPIENGLYIFKFWVGQDQNGNDLYEEHELVVE